ncbi:hypothetical protein GGS20DRAFT_532914 [Poronia punctata]|nr:hypothetical protein GGS20DRAFT_532914 [Poronia punctata]
MDFRVTIITTAAPTAAILFAFAQVRMPNRILIPTGQELTQGIMVLLPYADFRLRCGQCLYLTPYDRPPVTVTLTVFVSPPTLQPSAEEWWGLLLAGQIGEYLT